MSKNNIERLQEIGGMVTSKRTGGPTGFGGASQNPQSGGTPYYDPGYWHSGSIGKTIEGIKIDNCFRMRGWQKEVVHNLQRGDNVYVSVDPGGGKSTPIICYWADSVIGINPQLVGSARSTQGLIENVLNLYINPSSIRKLIFLVPVRALVDGMARNFRTVIADMTIQALTLLYQNLYPLDPSGSLLSGRASMLHLRDQFHNAIGERNSYYRSLNSRLTDILQRISLISPNTTPNYEDQMKNLTDQYNTLMNDYWKRTGEIIKSFIENNLVATRSGVHKDVRNLQQAPVIIAVTDSFLSMSTNQLGDPSLIVFDEAHLIQRTANEDNLENSKNAAKALDRALNNFHVIPRSGSTRFAMLSGTANPSAARNLANYINKCYFNGRMRLINVENAGNKTPIDVVADNDLIDDEYIKKLLKNPKGSYNVFIIFGKNRILKIVQSLAESSAPSKATMSDVQRGSYSPANTRYRDYSDQMGRQSNELEMDNVENIKKMGNVIKSTPEAMEIYEDKQRQAVSMGFGFIIRPDNREDLPREVLSDNRALRKYIRDQEIVARLFSEGKIHTLLATAAIGIGITLKIQNMYIPSIKNPPEYEKLKTSKASQLYNRIGRGKFDIGTIYTPSENIDDIIMALSAGKEDFEEGFNVKDKKCYFHSLVALIATNS